MSTLHIRLFGGISVSREESGGELRLSPLSAKLLAFLILQRHRAHPRQALIGYFWGDQDEEQARNCFNSTWWRLRRALEPGAACYLLSDPLGEVAFNIRSDFWFDVAEFEESLRPVLRLSPAQLPRCDLSRAESALDLYTGDLLEGHYDDWALRERERLYQLRFDSLTRLMDYYDWAGDVERSIDYGRQIVALDPLREDAHRALMRLYARHGQRSQALRQYAVCRELIHTAFGLPLMPETERLCAALSQDVEPPPPTSTSPPAPAASPPADLLEVARLLEEACRLLQQALNRD